MYDYKKEMCIRDRLVHDDFNAVSLADYNRCGVPLIEIVTEPDISSAEEAKAFVEKVSLLLQYAGVCDCKMEQGSLRACLLYTS